MKCPKEPLRFRSRSELFYEGNDLPITRKLRATYINHSLVINAYSKWWHPDLLSCSIKASYLGSNNRQIKNGDSIEHVFHCLSICTKIKFLLTRNKKLSAIIYELRDFFTLNFAAIAHFLFGHSDTHSSRRNALANQNARKTIEPMKFDFLLF